jgi:hypothetical protein
MGKEPQSIIMRICKVFNFICANVYDPKTYPNLKTRAIYSFCLLEQVFPLSFFDLMMHLVVHLIDKLDLCGHVHSHWMYPMERAMKDLKGYVRNMCKPEGSMVEGYIFNEALNVLNTCRDLGPPNSMFGMLMRRGCGKRGL